MHLAWAGPAAAAGTAAVAQPRSGSERKRPGRGAPAGGALPGARRRPRPYVVGRHVSDLAWAGPAAAPPRRARAARVAAAAAGAAWERPRRAFFCCFHFALLSYYLLTGAPRPHGGARGERPASGRGAALQEGR